MSLSLIEASHTAVEDPFVERLAGDLFDALYRRYQPRLMRLLRRRVGDLALAEDLAQDTLIRALAHIDSFDHNRPMWPWLKTIATRLAIDNARAHGREVLAFDTPDRVVDLDYDHEGALHEALTRLTPNQQTAVRLRYIDGWKAADAAVFLGISRDAFEQLLARARRRLRTEYARVAETALGILPLRRLRSAFARGVHNVRESANAIAPSGIIGSDLVAQFGSALIALVAAASATVAPPASNIPDYAVAFAAGGTEGTRIAADDRPRAREAGVTGATSSATEADREDLSSPRSDDPIEGVVDPNKNVQQPEDANIVSVEFVPDSGGRHAYAAGRVCIVSCDRVLFETTDGGATWTRLPAAGFEGDSLLLPPAGDKRIFAMGHKGLQFSLDGGRSFQLALAAGGSLATGAASISPVFGRGDSSILIGAQTLVRYRAESEAFEPFPSTLAGPLYPAFSPGYATDGRVLVGGLEVDAVGANAAPAVYSCKDGVCTSTILEGASTPPTMRFSGSTLRDPVFAFGKNAVYRSTDGARTFARLGRLEVGESAIWDVAVRGEDVFVAAAPVATDRPGALHVSADGGGSWTSRQLPFDSGRIRHVAVTADRLIVAFERSGLACSVDGGTTWKRRCPS